MTDFSYTEIVKNTVITEFHTNIPLVGSAFKTFIKSFTGKTDLTLSDIRDHRLAEKALATYAGDIIFMSRKKTENSVLSPVRGITALSEAVCGFKIFLPENIPPIPQVLEELFFYILPADKTYPFDGLINIGIVTSEKHFTVTAYDGRISEIITEENPRRVCINITSPDWFTRGFFDSVASALDKLSNTTGMLYSSIPSEENDCVAYRLGVFYASKCISGMKPRKKLFSLSSAKVYLFSPLIFHDGTPDIAAVQLISAILSDRNTDVITAKSGDDVAASVQDLLSGYAFANIAVPNSKNIQNGRMIITDRDLPLPILGIMSKYSNNQ